MHIVIQVYVACSIFLSLFAWSDQAWNLWITTGWSQKSANSQLHLSSLLKNKNGWGGDKEQKVIKISILTNGL